MKAAAMDPQECLELASNPIFFERNRVFRVYQGGKLFHDFFGDDAVDGSYPEEWIASGVRALNKDSQGEHEGVSKIRGRQLYFDELLTHARAALLGDRQKFDILVKVLDSAIRLPVQAHPDKAFSRQHLNSDFGKTEMWIVLATREDAKIYFGFRDGVTREDFVAAIAQSETDKSVMASLMNEVPVKPGDVYLITAKIVHAIGSGCLILEVQEPTDFTIQPEAWCGDYRLNDYEMYLGLGRQQALECFDFSMAGPQVVTRGRKMPTVIEETAAYRSEALIRYADTSCFAVNRHQLTKQSMPLTHAPAIFIVTQGAGVLQNEDYRQTVKKGDYFFLPFAAQGTTTIATETGLELIECLPSQRPI